MKKYLKLYAFAIVKAYRKFHENLEYKVACHINFKLFNYKTYRIDR